MHGSRPRLRNELRALSVSRSANRTGSTPLPFQSRKKLLIRIILQQKESEIVKSIPSSTGIGFGLNSTYHVRTEF